MILNDLLQRHLPFTKPWTYLFYVVRKNNYCLDIRHVLEQEYIIAHLYFIS